MPNSSLLLGTDLDRTLIPNGAQKESALARPLFRKLVGHRDLVLAYVSGRDIQLILNGIREYELPIPDYIIADVGSTIYQHKKDKTQTLAKDLLDSSSWQTLSDWDSLLSAEWNGQSSQDLAKRLGEFEHIAQQAASKQGQHKLSYQVTPSARMHSDIEILKQRLAAYQDQSTSVVDYQIVTSIDETQDEGLIDILPSSAGKLGALTCLANVLEVPQEHVFFSGDSGNDKDVLLSEFNGCVVNNATDEFKQILRSQAGNSAQRSDTRRSDTRPSAQSKLYFAHGALSQKLNGHYSAGIVEGFIHFYPHTLNWISEEMA